MSTTSSSSTKNEYCEPPLERNDIVPSPALISIGSSTEPTIVYSPRSKTSVDAESVAAVPSSPPTASPDSSSPWKLTVSPIAAPESLR